MSRPRLYIPRPWYWSALEWIADLKINGFMVAGVILSLVWIVSALYNAGILTW